MTDTTTAVPTAPGATCEPAPETPRTNGASQPAPTVGKPHDEHRWLRYGFGAVAVVLVILASSLPIWRSDLSAIQYPQGLELAVYGDRVAGDINEVDALNHYVGMRPYRFDDFWETALWLPTIGALVVVVVVATLTRRRWLARLARIGVWIAPVGVLADVQFRLWQFGHDLEPGAALRIDEFTPKVIGTTSVLNFDAWSYPGEAMFAIWGAAALITFGTWLVTRALPWLGRSINALLSDDAQAAGAPPG